MHSRFLLPLALFALPALPAFAAVGTWTNTSGQSMEAELVACHGDKASFRKADGTFYSYPVDKLAPGDQERVRAFAADNRFIAAASANASSVPAVMTPQPGKLTSDIAAALVAPKGSRFEAVKPESLAGVKYYALYFSAHWCPPCRQFTPELVSAYKQLKSAHPEFEVVFISSDKDEGAMMGYMKGDKMPWPAVRFDKSKSVAALKQYRERGIPNLVFVTADGEVLSASYVNGKYAGPRKVLKDIRQTLD
jgi:nucleoredoxin